MPIIKVYFPLSNNVCYFCLVWWFSMAMISYYWFHLKSFHLIAIYIFFRYDYISDFVIIFLKKCRNFYTFFYYFENIWQILYNNKITIHFDYTLFKTNGSSVYYLIRGNNYHKYLHNVCSFQCKIERVMIMENVYFSRFNYL